MSHKTRMVGGPANGEFAMEQLEMIAIPLGQNLNRLKDKVEPFAFAIYRLGHKGSQAFYQFLHVQRHPDPNKGFDIEFVDGPLKGIQPFSQAIQFYDSAFRVAFGKDGKPLTKGCAVGGIAEYQRKEIDGVWKMALVRTIDDPREIETLADTIAEHELTRELQAYTTEQLVKELATRPTFFGVVLMFPWEGRIPKKGDQFAMAIGRPLTPENAKVVLHAP